MFTSISLVSPCNEVGNVAESCFDTSLTIVIKYTQQSL